MSEIVQTKTVGSAFRQDSAMAILVELLDREICRPTENLVIQKKRHRGRRLFDVVALTPFPNEHPAYTDEVRYWQAIESRRDEREAVRQARDAA